MANDKKKERISSTGFGESKVTSTASPEDIAAHNETSLTGIPPRIYWTVKGVPVSELPDGNLITYSLTDQAVADRARAREEKIAEGWPEEIVNQPRIKSRTDMPEPLKHLANATDPDDKAIAAMADRMLEEEFDPSVFSANPLDLKADRYTSSGMSPYWGRESDASTDKLRGFKPVLDEKGQPVTHGELTLLERPERVQLMELNYHKKMTNEMASAITQADETQTSKHFREDLGLPSAPPSLQGIGLGLGDDSSSFG